MTDEPWVELSRFARPGAAEELCFVLQTVDIPTTTRVETISNGVAIQIWVVLVLERHLARARQVLSEEQPVDPARARAIDDAPPSTSRPALYWVAALMVVNICVWIVQEGTGGSESRANLIRFGASFAPSILAGEWWRPVTATFLHIGAKHLLGNMISLALFGALTLGQWGAGRFYCIYVLSGVAGNLASLALSPTPSAKAGASGSILGLLGALAGRRIREIRRARRAAASGATYLARPSRFKSWHVGAMLVAFYGFVVGTGHADHLAHVGGIIAGLLFGLLLPPPRSLQPAADRALSLGCGLGTLVLVALAAALAAGRASGRF